MYLPIVTPKNFEVYKKRTYSGDTSNAFKILVAAGRWRLGSRSASSTETELTISVSTSVVVYVKYNKSTTDTLTISSDTAANVNALLSGTSGHLYWPLATVVSDTDSVYKITDMWEGGDIFSQDEAITGPYHFKVSVISATQITVSGGTHETYARGNRYAVNLTCDGGVSGDLADFKTLSLKGSGTNYVVLTKSGAYPPGDDATAPTLLQVDCSLTAPTAAKQTDKLIAHFTVSSGAIVMSSLVQDWNGGNIREYWAEPDDLSMNYVPGFGGDTGKYQDKDWSSATSIGGPYHLENSDLFMYQNRVAGRIKKYVSWEKLVDEMILALEGHHFTVPTDDVSININNTTEIQLYEFDAATDAGAIAAGDFIVFKDVSTGVINYISFSSFVGNVNHHDLKDISTDTAIYDDHDGSLTAGAPGGNFPYVSGKDRPCTGTTVHQANAFATGGGIGDHSYALSIDPDGRTLRGDWYQYDANKHLFVQGNEAISTGVFGSGALRVTGGVSVGDKVQADGFYITDESTINYWTIDYLKADVGNMYLYSDGLLEVQSDTNLAIDANALLTIDWGTLKINGNFWQEEPLTVIKDGAEVTRTILVKVP
jgi:hypothetical protein